MFLCYSLLGVVVVVVVVVVVLAAAAACGAALTFATTIDYHIHTQNSGMKKKKNWMTTVKVVTLLITIIRTGSAETPTFPDRMRKALRT